MKKNPFQITTKKELRKAFWQYCQEINYDTTGKKSKFNLDANMLFNDWKDFLCKDGVISQKLYDTTSLY